MYRIYFVILVVPSNKANLRIHYALRQLIFQV